jgi:putative hydroxymethylpyrimidine transport system substrate-binding protein
MDAYVPSDTSAQISLIAAGRSDFGISYETDLFIARAKHIPVRSVMCLMQHPLNTIMSLKGSGITRPKDLEGHSIGIAGSPSDIPNIAAMIKHDGGSMSKVHVVDVSSALLPALLGHKVDAVMDVYWTWEAIQARQQGYSVNVMRFEKWGVPNYCELVLITSEKFLYDHSGLVRSTVNAMQQGYAYAAAHPSAAWNALRAKDATLKQALVMDSLRLLERVVTDAPTIGYQNLAQWSRYERWLWTNHVIPKSINPADAFTNQFLAPGRG